MEAGRREEVQNPCCNLGCYLGLGINIVSAIVVFCAFSIPEECLSNNSKFNLILGGFVGMVCGCITCIGGQVIATPDSSNSMEQRPLPRRQTQAPLRPLPKKNNLVYNNPTLMV